MENVYDIYQHSHCLFIYFDSDKIYSTVIYTLLSDPSIEYINELRNSFLYDKQKSRVLNYHYEDECEDSIVIDNLKHRLHCAFKKGEEKWNDDDKFFIKAVSDFIRKIFKSRNDYENENQVHHVFIVPSEWEHEIREKLIRPIYIEAGLISKDDHNDRLLFISEVECIFYNLQQHHHFERGQYTVLSRVSTLEDGTAIIKLDLIRTMSALFDFPESKLNPYVVNSETIHITPQDFSDEITTFLDTKIAALTTKEGSVHSLVGDIYKNIGKLIVSMDNLLEYTDLNNWEGIEAFEIFQNYDKIFGSRIKTRRLIEDAMKTVVQNNFTRDYRFVTLINKCGENFRHSYTSSNLIKSALTCNALTANRKSQVAASDYISDMEPSDLFKGAAFRAFETIKNCSMHGTPNIRTTECPVMSPSVFSNKKLNAIISIDISCKFTRLSFSVLNDDESIKKIYDNHIITNDSLLSICDAWSTMPFDKRESICSSIFADQDLVIKQKFMLNIERILKDGSEKTAVVSVSQRLYIKSYIQEYFVYIKNIISSSSFSHLNPDDIDINVGYTVSTEKIMLENLIGTKKDFQEVIYASGLVNPSDESKKLVILTQGERLLPLIKKYVKWDFLINTYFVLAQLHEDYIQLALNRVVTSCNAEEKEQESIVIQEEIIPIKNVYQSLCINMWKHIAEEISLIKLCDEHKSCDDSEKFQLFSMENRNKFMENFEAFISDKIFKKNSNIQITDKHVIEFSSTCKCEVCLTIYDIVQISFEPVLQDIATTVSASLINKELFGKHLFIKYAFSLVYFNYNLQFQHIIQKILSNETKTFNIEKGIETKCLVIPEPSNYFLQPNIKQQLHLVKGFRIGTLRQVFSQSYCFRVDGLYGYGETFSSIIRSGDIASNRTYNSVYHVKLPENSNRDTITIRFYIFYNLKDNEPVTSEYFNTEFKSYSMKFDRQDYCIDNTIPIIVSLESRSYSSSLIISSYFSGKDTLKSNTLEIREPMSLARS